MKGILGTLWERRAAMASIVTLTVATLVISILAVVYRGIPTADVDLDGGGVWVTNRNDNLVGHLNYPSRILDAIARPPMPDFDVLQEDESVLVVDSAGATAMVVDTATAEWLGDFSIPEGALLALGGTTVAIVDAGFLHIVPFSSLAGKRLDDEDAFAEVGAASNLAVSRDGTRVFVASATNAQLLSVDLDTEQVDVVELADVEPDAELSLTVVGHSAVVQDVDAGVLFLPGGKRVEDPAFVAAVLQQPSLDTRDVWLTTPRSLLRQPLAGGPVETALEVAAGAPAAPVWLGGCAYAVWGGSGTYARDCVGEADDAQIQLDLDVQARPVLRSNHRVVVVNDTRSGTVWVVNEAAERVENWEDLLAKTTDEDEDEDEGEDEQPQNQLPERQAENRPPLAVDDSYGIRPGRTSVLRVTENDSDPDGDLLTVSLLSDAPAGYAITPVLGGSALQAAVPADAEGMVQLRYRADDGRGGTDDAAVTLAVRPWEVNSPPVLERPLTLQVEAGASATYYALEGWKDPDGDDLFLVGATVGGGDVVSFRMNGVLEYSAASGEPGVKEVVLEVSDGRETTEGVLRVDVRPAGSLNPIANSDRYTAPAGIPITLEPLRNDVSRNGERLRLSQHETPTGAEVVPDYDSGTLEFLAENQGIYYLQYTVTAGPRSAAGLIRVDVVAAEADDQPPLAVRDTALLPVGREVLVDVLANDSDPNGGILVVQSARVAAGAGISAEVLEHSILRIADVGSLSEPVSLTYVISNGSQSAEGEVLVVPVPLPEALNPPVAVDDIATVRAGDVVNIDVLANDYHPDNDTIRLVPELVERNVGDGEIFVDGDRLRFHAGPDAGTAYATYEVVDSQGNRDAGYVSIRIIAADSGVNSAPRPKALTARVIAGNSVRIAVPLDGIDPDGDSVEIVGVTSHPSLGTVSVGDAWFVYEAYPEAAGRDVFTYEVRDRFGAVAESTISVGVAPPGADNQAPYAVKDTVVVPPGRVVAVAVTVNDSDPDGDPIAIVSDGLEVPNGIAAEVVGGRVVVTAPREPGEYTIGYTIVDPFGATADGVLLVVVDPDAPPAAPIARDDRVPREQVDLGRVIAVDVRENDEDPDGTAEALRVEVFDPNARVLPGGLVEVVVEEHPQIIRYSVTDEDGLSAQAFVYVPAADAAVPALRSTEPIVVDSGERVTIPLAEYVQVREGREPRIATADSLRTGHSDGSPLIVDETTLSYTSAEGYFGRDSLGVLVTDGTGPDDPEGLSAYLAIPILVLPPPAENQSPTLRGTGISVAAGEDAETVDLLRLASDPDEGDLERLVFSLDASLPPGVSATVSGAILTVRAEPSVTPGTAVSLAITADDGVSEPGTGTIEVEVVASQRRLAVANDDVIGDAVQGQRRLVDVLANDVNPYEGQTPLTVVSARVDTPGAHSASVEGRQVAVTPAADFHGTLIVTYRVGDATGAREREVEGRILLTVRGRPSAPGVPIASSIQDSTVVLSWAPSANNGSPVTGYEVTSQNGYSKLCAATTCTLDGLTNNVEYTFQVVAINDVGRSDPSPVSAVMRPDTWPDTPAAPALAFGDRQLTVTWTTPPSKGSPVTSFDLEISPAPASGTAQKTGVTGNSTVWTGLQNGVAYQVRVRAINNAPRPSEWSTYSASMIPAGVPDAPGQPQTTPATPVGSQAQIAVSWSAPASDNGDAVAGYTLLVKRGGALLQSIPVSGTSQNVVVDTNQTDYTFAVTARNKAGTSAVSADSAPRRGATAPGAPASVTLTPGDRRVTVTFQTGALNGNRANELTHHYRVNQTGAQGTISSGGAITGLTNGTSYTVSLWATSSVSGVAPGPEATSTAAVPFGAPIITNFTATRLDNAVRFTWTVSSNGRPLQSPAYGVGVSGGNGTHTVTGLSPSQSTTLNLSYTNEAGTTTASQTGRANDPPPPSGSVRKGNSAAAESGCTSGGCNYVHLTTTNLPAGNYRVQCWTTQGGTGHWYNQVINIPAGGRQLPCWFGFPGQQVWVVVDGQLTTPRITW